MIEHDLAAAGAELSGAEDFLDHFGVAYDQSVVQVNRLHILQRFHGYLAKIEDWPADPAARHALYGTWLTRAYQDFVTSDARTERVFRVFNQPTPAPATTGFVPLDQLGEG